jgi:hypothetical protein
MTQLSGHSFIIIFDLIQGVTNTQTTKPGA